jgi:hypothetical protein
MEAFGRDYARRAELVQSSRHANHVCCAQKLDCYDVATQMPVSRHARFAHLSPASFIAARNIHRRAGFQPDIRVRVPPHALQPKTTSIGDWPNAATSIAPKALKGIFAFWLFQGTSCPARQDRRSTEATFARDYAHSIAVRRRSERDRHGSQPGSRRSGRKIQSRPRHNASSHQIQRGAGRGLARFHPRWRLSCGLTGMFLFRERPHGNKSFTRSVFFRGQIDERSARRRQRDRSR